MDIKKQVHGFIMENFVMGSTGKALDDNSSFLDNGIIDSTSVLELVLFLEQTFDIRVGDAEMVPENLDSLHNIEGYINRKRA